MSLLGIIILLNNIFSNLHIRNNYRNFASQSETDGRHAFQNDASAGFPQGDYITSAIQRYVEHIRLRPATESDGTALLP